MLLDGKISNTSIFFVYLKTNHMQVYLYVILFPINAFFSNFPFLFSQLFYRFAAWSFTQSSSLKLWAWKFTTSSTGVTAWHGVQLYSRLGVPSFIAWTLRTTKTTIRTNSLKLEKKDTTRIMSASFLTHYFLKHLWNIKQFAQLI